MNIDWSLVRLPPFHHQIEDAETVTRMSYLFITSEMRTGKTKIVIDGAQFLYLNDVIERVITVAPAPVRAVWFDEDLGELSKHLFVPTVVTELHNVIRSWRYLEGKSLHWVVTNYEFLRNPQHLTEILTLAGPKTLLVLDESSFIGNAKSKQSEACYTLRWHCGRVILLNGTPISHSPENLFSQGNTLHPSILDCKFISQFRARYAIMSPVLGRGGKALIDKWGNVIKTPSEWQNLGDLQKRFSHCTIRRLQKDCLDLPPKLEPKPLIATLKSETWRIYKQMRDECVVMFESGDASVAAQAIVKTIRLSQITSGFLGGIEDFKPTDEMPDWMKDEDDIANSGTQSLFDTAVFADKTRAKIETKEIGREKLDVLLWWLGELLEQNPSLHVVTWCRFRAELTRLLESVREKFPQFRMGAIYGGQKRDERLEAMQLLNPKTSPKEAVFVGGTYGTGAFGLNFTAANTSISLSFDYSLGKFLQTMDRVYGPGQVSPVAYYDIIASGPQGQKTIDHAIIKARHNREEIANWVSSDWVKALKDE